MAKIDLVFDKNYPNLKFVIMEQPKPLQVQHTLQELKKFDVTHVTRVCEEFEFDYNPEFEEHGIACHAWPFPDGASPPQTIILEWLALCDSVSKENEKSGKKVDSVGSGRSAIAIHCVAGLGRAPLMVALAFIEAGMSSEQAVMLLRAKRKGCINANQLAFLKQHKRLKSGGACCTIL
eukprot:TRINITY_DN9080_c0_g1_i6.p1 TRINITY_DN9080_c0_g1~~TRINITY_DN9080_c0_g1_i6.p1  ORF type:complete len:178 (+),score=22.46 TRINITY_DN9080_c0_g1_i6:318-851(+)